ncbi:biotin-dependent carboxyltransferase [Caldicellulosiruptor changbaiensis]|uniref:Biotin-dependent carboxyltransferase n=1 Tax=Caldicellulosiruptor changbaiensis TaxID=1222016 RepID=A0A3T0D7V8_9FIRM|nr:biotin-dependent carboxyltransferase family protein [Caldicellulosiruptor changbaiensis]AZT90912.1 biotin-dependent carboxyltransferase [Caldicellulosiruptor changbaiensis]
MECFKVLNPGFFTTIQDLGRYGYESQGVPNAGAMDEFALRIANILVDNHENAPCLEITLVGPVLEVLNDTMIAVAGAEIQPLVNGFSRPCWSSFPVRKGDVITFRPVKSGFRAYLAVAGGLKGEFAMGSFSTYVNGKLGGVKGRPIAKGDILESGVPKHGLVPKKIRDEFLPIYSEEEEIRVILGPQDNYFTKEAIEIFLNSTYLITEDSNRMGYRLEGPPIKAKEKHDIITDGVVPGSIQVPANGKPIILLKDAPTTGGYVKIATVISPDLSKLAQLKPGDRLKFKAIDLLQAHQVLSEFEDKIGQIKKSLNMVRYFHVRINEKDYDIGLEIL